MQKRLFSLGPEKKAGMPPARIDCSGICAMIPINGFHLVLHVQVCLNNPDETPIEKGVPSRTLLLRHREENHESGTVLLAFHKVWKRCFSCTGHQRICQDPASTRFGFKGHTLKRKIRFHYGINGRRKIILLPAAQERKAPRSGAGSIRCSSRRLPYASLRGQTKSLFRPHGERLQRY